MEIIHIPAKFMQPRRTIPVFEFGPALLAHHTHSMFSSEPKPADPREQAVLPGDPDHIYRATPASIAHAKQQAAREREEVEREQRSFELRKLKAMDQLTVLVGEFGYVLVESWLQHVGRAERP